MAGKSPEIRVISEGELLNRDRRTASDLTLDDQPLGDAGTASDMRPSEWAYSLADPTAALYSDPNGYRTPICWVEAGPDDFRISIELPGAGLADIDLAVGSGEIVVTTDRESDEPGWQSGRFHGALTVADAADLENATAEFENGLLLIMVPRKRAPERRRVEISSGSEARPAPDRARGRKTTE